MVGPLGALTHGEPVEWTGSSIEGLTTHVQVDHRGHEAGMLEDNEIPFAKWTCQREFLLFRGDANS